MWNAQSSLPADQLRNGAALHRNLVSTAKYREGFVIAQGLQIW